MEKDFPDPALWIDTIYHPHSAKYRVEAKLRLPGRTVFTGEKDLYLDTALQRCLQKMIRKVEMYNERSDREAAGKAERRNDLDREVIAPEALNAGPLA